LQFHHQLTRHFALTGAIERFGGANEASLGLVRYW
jgi:hypothetical protein